MFRILVLFACLGAVIGAPQKFYQHRPMGHHHPSPFRQHYDPYHEDIFRDDYFDTGRFWAELSQELQSFHRSLEEFYRRFPSSVSHEGIEGNRYKITISLTGFQEKDIVVKAREGMLMIQAIHKNEDGSEKHYLDVRTLPTYVNVSGSWTYDNEVLRVVFPLTASPTTDIPSVDANSDDTTLIVDPETNSVTTSSPESREHMEPTYTENASGENADVGINTNRVEDHDIRTNEIVGSGIEATTYAVDLKNEVEFVPVRY